MGALEDDLDEAMRQSGDRLADKIKITEAKHPASMLDPATAAVRMKEFEQRRQDAAKGPIIVWHDYGCEGWQPESYPSLFKAVLDGALNGTFKVTVALNLEDCINEP